METCKSCVPVEDGRTPAATDKSGTAYLWGALALLSCPCHLPIFGAVLAGTAAGAFVGEHWVIAAAALTGVFVLSALKLQRAFRAQS